MSEDNNQNISSANSKTVLDQTSKPFLQPNIINSTSKIMDRDVDKVDRHRALLFLIMLAFSSFIALTGVYFYYRRDGQAIEQESLNYQEIVELKQQIFQLEYNLESCSPDSGD